jgi:hypothetical protein
LPLRPLSFFRTAWTLNPITMSSTAPQNPPPPSRGAYVADGGVSADHQIVSLDQNLRHIYHWFGPHTVLIPVPCGQAQPPGDAWRSTTLAQSRAPEYQAKLWNADVGILCGAWSGNLCAVRFDDEPALGRFLADNPALRGSLITGTPTGTFVWCRIDGFYPLARKFEGLEWLAQGRLAVVYARPPRDHGYRCLNAVRPLVLPFSKIVWPASIRPAFLGETLTFHYGAPFTANEAGEITLNEHYVVAHYAQDRRVLYEPARKQFYRFDSASNRYRVDHEERIMSELSTVLLDLSRQPWCKTGLVDRSHGFLRSLVKLLKVVAVGTLPGEQDAFDRFWREAVEKAKGCDLTTEELFDAYVAHCSNHSLPAYPEGEFQRLVPDFIREHFGVCKRHSILRDGKARRGFPNIRLKAEPAV